MIDVAGNIARVRERVARAAARAGRSPDSVRIVAVSKTQPLALIEAAVRAGIADIGENYVQEAAAKIEAIRVSVRWHLIGHLQRNKAARAVALFDMIQTVDSLPLADALDRHAAQRGRVLPVLVEVNVAGEASKSGVAPERLGELVEALRTRTHLELRGLMSIPPAAASIEAMRGFFAMLRRLRDDLRDASALDLSMGMSDDFEVAIEEGATIVRIGRAIFGPRGV
jgi:hypothetical protein